MNSAILYISFPTSLDVEALMHIVRFSNKMTQTGPLASVVTGCLMPPADVMDDDEKLKG
jgi:hypothetical protein